MITPEIFPRFMHKREYPGPWQHSVYFIPYLSYLWVRELTILQSFGFGRRICPGMYLAANSVFIK
jgi:cytochrome P450